MPSRRVEQVRIPVFECFSLTTKCIIVTARHQIYFDMLDVANARLEVSILFFSSAVRQQLRIKSPTEVRYHTFHASLKHCHKA